MAGLITFTLQHLFPCFASVPNERLHFIGAVNKTLLIRAIKWGY